MPKVSMQSAEHVEDHGIVVDRHGKRFHDEGEDARKTHFARWGARIAQCEGQIAYLILDSKGLARALPTVLAPRN